MSDLVEYYVLPDDTRQDRIPLTDSEKRSVHGLPAWVWFGVWVSVYFVCGALVYSVLSLGISTLAGIIVATATVVVGAVGVKNSRVLDLEKKKAQLDAETSRKDAAAVTSRLRSTYNDSVDRSSRLTGNLSDASGWLRHAESEYRNNAYSPFWDAVQNGAWHLGAFNSNLNGLSCNASEYYKALDGRKHTFPVFPVSISSVPDASSVMIQLARVVRLGQTNFEFANIWEHRRTREVLIAGFRTLGDALNTLGATIEHSVSALQQSVSSDAAMVVQEGIRTGEQLDRRMLEQNRMLDSMQRR